MTASGLPAVLIRLAMSAIPGAFSGDALPVFDLDDIAEMAESIDEFLGAPFASSARTPEEPAMAAGWLEEEPPGGFGFTTGSETLRVSFGNRCERGGGAGLAGAWLVRGSTLIARGRNLWRQERERGEEDEDSMTTHPGLLSSGVVAPEDSL